MTETRETKNPQVELANKDWVLREIMDTERRIEKAFHEQTQFLHKENGDLRKDIANQTRWMVGLMLTMTIAIILAVLFK